MHPLRRAVAASVLLLSAAGVRAEDWPQWRGPRGDGISRETGLAEKWPDGGPAKVWSAAVGTGHASPVAVDGKVYLFTQDEPKGMEVLEAFDAETGKRLWGQSNRGGYTGGSPDWRGTRATPTVVGDAIYTYGGTGDLIARNLADGKELWHTNVLKETNAQPLEWGEASSPLVAGDAIYVQGGRGAGAPAAVRVNRKDGQIVWKSEAVGVARGSKSNFPTGGGYAQPLLVSAGGATQLVVLAGEAVYGMDPATGKTLWKEPWLTAYDVNATTPVYLEPHLFISTGYGHGCMMLELSAAGAKKLWEKKDVASKFNGVILDRGYLYANSNDAGVIKCLKWPEGTVAWEGADPSLRLGAGGSILRYDDHLVTQSERGKLSLTTATPEGLKKVSQVSLLEGGNLWATPLIYKGKLYVKGAKELICLDVAAK